MSDPATDRPTAKRSRWPLILGGLLGGFLLVGAGLGLGWYLFYRPIVNVAVQLPAPPAPPAPPGPDAAAGQGARGPDRQAEGRQQADRGPDRGPQGSPARRRVHGQGSRRQGRLPQQSPMPAPAKAGKSDICHPEAKGRGFSPRCWQARLESVERLLGLGVVLVGGLLQPCPGLCRIGGEARAALGEQHSIFALRLGIARQRRALVPVGGARAVGREALLGGQGRDRRSLRLRARPADCPPRPPRARSGRLRAGRRLAHIAWRARASRRARAWSRDIPRSPCARISSAAPVPAWAAVRAWARAAGVAVAVSTGAGAAAGGGAPAIRLSSCWRWNR